MRRRMRRHQIFRAQDRPPARCATDVVHVRGYQELAAPGDQASARVDANMSLELSWNLRQPWAARGLDAGCETGRATRGQRRCCAWRLEAALIQSPSRGRRSRPDRARLRPSSAWRGGRGCVFHPRQNSRVGCKAMQRVVARVPMPPGLSFIWRNHAGVAGWAPSASAPCFFHTSRSRRNVGHRARSVALLPDQKILARRHAHLERDFSPDEIARRHRAPASSLDEDLAQQLISVHDRTHSVSLVGSRYLLTGSFPFLPSIQQR